MSEERVAHIHFHDERVGDPTEDLLLVSDMFHLILRAHFGFAQDLYTIIFTGRLILTQSYRCIGAQPYFFNTMLD